MNFLRRKIIDLCISILRKNKVSVLIGYRVDGNMRARHDHTCMYDSDLYGIHFLKSGERWDIPKGKFYMEREVESHDN